uniref:Uncharacterized protein n=1 Tax=Oryza barthii TaxID=65489 RepID=A0A0D3HD95_9ORYZ
MESGSASSASAAASTTASSPVLQLPAPPSHATAATQDTSPTAGYKTQAIIDELDIESVERHLANLLIVEKEENNDDMEQDDILMDEMDE